MNNNLRVRILSQRGTRPTVARCMGFEFEDRAAQLLDGETVIPTHNRRSKQRERLVRGVAKRWTPGAGFSPKYPQPDIGPGNVDVMIMHCQFPGDALLLHALPHWRRRTGKAIAFIEEMWSGSVDSWGGILGLFQQFDHVYVGISRPAKRLAERIDTHVDYLPYSVDTTRFAPDDLEALRPIDVLATGRRSPTTHAALYEWSRREHRFYHYDSYTPGTYYDPAEHRVMYSRLHQQSAFAISNRGVGASTAGNVGEEALPARYFETAAAGGVLVGQPPTNDEFAAEFGWEDSVIHAPFDDPDIPERLIELASDPIRIAGIRRRNVEETMRRHDTSHRLVRMLADVGIDAPESLREAVDDRLSTANSISPTREG